VIFPVGFAMIVLLNLELVTGSFAVLPMAQMDERIRFADTLRNWAYSYAGNLAGSLIYAGLAWGALTMFGDTAAGPVGDRMAAIADAKTLAYAAHGGVRLGCGVRQSDALQLDGLYGGRHERGRAVDGLQDRGGLAAHLHFLSGSDTNTRW